MKKIYNDTVIKTITTSKHVWNSFGRAIKGEFVDDNEISKSRKLTQLMELYIKKKGRTHGKLSA